jgi:Ni/Co efflux regulator RcnB
VALSRRTSLIWAAALALAPGLALAQIAHAIPRRGEQVPQAILNAGPIANYAALHLRKPPVGYGWYQIGHAYAMASISTGLITDVVLL